MIYKFEYNFILQILNPFKRTTTRMIKSQSPSIFPRSKSTSKNSRNQRPRSKRLAKATVQRTYFSASSDTAHVTTKSRTKSTRAITKAMHLGQSQ
jgi:hypothetical protein